ncbi:MAG: sulfur carrier protein ThiS adenylyltransferase ThiF [Ruminococcus flavefaciens]|nr:sulfur carrier protein ThiS adenylyltransferase ThiF [Ruminococcus flavefaciens]MCM1229155.1 sulfur carrier protein ThiS adenylyltransferase ThiF [Ruminococcus flavefaciens]
MGIPSYEEVYASLAERHGAELQKKLSQASVAVCGLGGLGSNIAILLARAGVGNLHIIDFDRVDISNVNRQQYFLEQLGQYKTDALYDTLKKILPYINIKRTCIRLTEDNIPDILHGEDIICEAFDNAESKAELVNCVLENMPDKYLVSGSGMAGLGNANAIQTRRITDRFYICGDGESDIADGMGLVASRVAVCAGHQAHKIIQIINGSVEK